MVDLEKHKAIMAQLFSEVWSQAALSPRRQATVTTRATVSIGQTPGEVTPPRPPLLSPDVNQSKGRPAKSPDCLLPRHGRFPISQLRLDRHPGSFLVLLSSPRRSSAHSLKGRPANWSGVFLPAAVETGVEMGVRVVPRRAHYVGEVVYEREPEENDLNPSLIARIDLGIDNFITFISNQAGFIPLAVNGRAPVG